MPSSPPISSTALPALGLRLKIVPMFSRLYRAFWLAAFLALAIEGVRMHRASTPSVPLVNHGPDGSVDSLLERTLGEPGLAEPIVEWLRKLPPGRALLILAPSFDSQAALEADLISYLAWPRPAVVICDSDGSTAALGTFRERYAAVALCHWQIPPGTPGAKQFGPGLTLLPSHPLAE